MGNPGLLQMEETFMVMPMARPLSATSPISQAIDRPCCALRPRSTSLPYRDKRGPRQPPLLLSPLPSPLRQFSRSTGRGALRKQKNPFPSVVQTDGGHARSKGLTPPTAPRMAVG